MAAKGRYELNCSFFLLLDHASAHPAFPVKGGRTKKLLILLLLLLVLLVVTVPYVYPGLASLWPPPWHGVTTVAVWNQGVAPCHDKKGLHALTPAHPSLLFVLLVPFPAKLLTEEYWAARFYA